MKLRGASVLAAIVLVVLVACTPKLGYLNSPQGEGATGSSGHVVVSNAVIALSGPLDSAVAYRAGSSAPLSASIVNSGDDEDRLVSVSSPVAGGAAITGDPTLSGGHVLAVGSQPGAQILPDTRSVQVTLTPLRQDLLRGMSYPVVFRFARAGEIPLELPIVKPSDDARSSGTPAAFSAPASG